MHARGALVRLLDREGVNQKTVALGTNTHRSGPNFALQTLLGVLCADFGMAACQWDPRVLGPLGHQTSKGAIKQCLFGLMCSINPALVESDKALKGRVVQCTDRALPHWVTGTAKQ